MATHNDEHVEFNLNRRQRGLLAAEIRWMAFYAPHLDFSLALRQAELSDKATRAPRDQGGDA